jgi:two-component system phosphate regulon response regulator PhoB
VTAAILFIDPDIHVAQAVIEVFAVGGIAVAHVNDAEEAAARLRVGVPNAIVLEWVLPGLSGVELTRRLRAHPRTSDIPLLMLSARDTEKDRLAGFESGVDDFLGKPFSPRELLARVRALMRRVDGPGELEVLQVGTLRLDPRAQRVSCDAHEVSLGLTEFRLLELLMRRPNRVMNRAQIVDHLWGKRALVSERTVDVHVRRLRKNLDETGYASRLQTVRGEGYVFVARQDGDSGEDLP